MLLNIQSQTMEEISNILLQELLLNLEEHKRLHIDVTEKMTKADNAKMYPLDLMGISIAKRSMSLIKGFVEMIKQENLICAIPLLRLQLDNSLRFYAAFLVENPHELASHFIEGEAIRRLTEKNTHKKLTDRLLVERLSEHYPWIVDVYEKTSGYIHLSDYHLFKTLNKVEPDKITAVIGDSDSYISIEEKIKTVNTMVKLTTIVLWLINSWALTKETPNIQDWKEKNGPGTGYKVI